MLPGNYMRNSNVLNNSKSKTLGYARVSTDEQKLDLQLHALREAGCNRLFVDKGISGGESDRPGLTKALTSLRPGDTLVVWRLDRLGRSLINLIQLIETLGRHGINFRSLNENIDATSSGGRLIFHMMAALCEFERTLISERTKAGMDAARRRGRRKGLACQDERPEEPSGLASGAKSCRRWYALCRVFIQISPQRSGSDLKLACNLISGQPHCQTTSRLRKTIFCQRRWATQPRTTPPRRLQPGFRSFADQRSLKLRQGGHDVKHEPSAG